jgi:hypothetical protein
MQERLREQQRDRSNRVRDANDGARRAKQRRQQPEQAERHRQQEAQRYEGLQLPPTEEDMRLTRIVDAGEGRPSWLKGARVSEQARAANAARERRKQRRRRRRRQQRPGRPRRPRMRAPLQSWRRRGSSASPPITRSATRRRSSSRATGGRTRTCTFAASRPGLAVSATFAAST